MIKNLRTIKTLRKLATKKVTAVALFDFRSLEEIKEYANNVKQEVASYNNSFNVITKSLAVSHSIVKAAVIRKLNTTTDKLKAPDFVKPNMDKLTKAFSIVDKYQDKIDSLDSVINILQLEFKGERGAPDSLKELKTLKAQIKTKLDNAYSFLSELAHNHEPQSFKNLVDTVYKKVQEGFGNSYDDNEHVVYMIPQNDDSVLISHYIELKNFEDDNGYIHASYYLVISDLVNINTSKSTYFVNALVGLA